MRNFHDEGEWQWPEPCTHFKNLEKNMRCNICGEYLHGPVLLPCSHTFCSECIRRYLQCKGSNGCCPECKIPCNTSELRSNPTLERLVIDFAAMKPGLLHLFSNGSTLSEYRAVSKNLIADESAAITCPERLPLVSYSVMKDKEIRKLLEASGLESVAKDREEMIQLHKEYVLQLNAQADSCQPKSREAICEQLIQHFRIRQKEKARLEGTKHFSVSISGQLTSTFKKLQEQIKQRGQLRSQEKQEEEVWRHVCPVNSTHDFYIHRDTLEIRKSCPQFLTNTDAKCEREYSGPLDMGRTKETESKDSVMELNTTSQPKDHSIAETMEWECARCTLYNSSSIKQCEACGYEDQSRRGTPSKKQYQSTLSKKRKQSSMR